MDRNDANCEAARTDASASGDVAADDRPEFAEELRPILKRLGEEARREAFAAGQSVMIVRSSRLWLLHPDGREEDVGPANGDAVP